jgi:hypothetical protein
LNKNEAKNKLKSLKERAKPLLSMRGGSQDFKKWYRDTEVAIERIFGQKTRHTQDFEDISYSLMAFSSDTPDFAFKEAYRRGVNTAITVIDSFIDEIEEYWD